MSTKDVKEAFVSNLEGTSPLEIFLIAGSVPVGLYVFLFLCRLNQNTALNEVLAFWVPAILCQSVWSFPWALLYFGVCILTGSVFGAAKEIDSLRGHEASIHLTQFCITIYRGSLLCLTCVAILAVDFNFYPRRLAKTEVQGYGWMDLGAASFVIAAGMVSRNAKKDASRNARMGCINGGANNHKRLSRILPVLVMGTLRLVTHKGIEYHEHASEYGVHWNFFFTLAMLTPLSLLLPHPILPIILMAAYQYFLTFYGLQNWVEKAPRNCDISAGGFLCNAFYANREGILGCIGYCFLFFASERIALLGIWSKKANLWVIVVGLFSVWQTLDAVGFPVSRRTTNLAFCVWALLVNFLQLALIQTISTTMWPFPLPKILDAINCNGLLVFVIANLLTGFVNLTMDTIRASHFTALFVLGGYTATVGVCAVSIQMVKKHSERRRTSSLKKNK